MEVLEVKQCLQPIEHKNLNSLPVGSYLLLLKDEDKEDKNYWAVCTINQGNNCMVVIINGYFAFDITDKILGYIKLETP